MYPRIRYVTIVMNDVEGSRRKLLEGIIPIRLEGLRKITRISNMSHVLLWSVPSLPQFSSSRVLTQTFLPSVSFQTANCLHTPSSYVSLRRQIASNETGRRSWMWVDNNFEGGGCRTFHGNILVFPGLRKMTKILSQNDL